MQDPKAYIATHKERMLDELIELLKIASVSADPAYKEECIALQPLPKNIIGARGMHLM